MSSLVAGARAELGLPAPSSPPPTRQLAAALPVAQLMSPERQVLPAVATSVTPSLDVTSLGDRVDAIGSTVAHLGSHFRPAMQALADVANRTTSVLDASEVDAAAGDQHRAVASLAVMYAQGIARGEDALPRAPRMEGNKVDLLVRNANYLPRLYEDLESAQHSITVNQFSWEPDGSGLKVAQLLADKARAGLDVRVLVDGYGINERGKDVAKGLEQDLEAAGVKFVRTGAWRPGGSGWEHRKLITIDDKVAYTGGLGFGAKYDTWTDLMLRMEGPVAAVAHATSLASFRDVAGVVDPAMHQQIGGVAAALRGALSGVAQVRRGGPPMSTALADAKAAVTILDNRPGTDLQATEAFLRDAASAKQRFWTTSTYITTPVAKQALMDASRRGVDVKLIVTSPEAGNDTKQISLGRAMYRDMIDSGIEVFEWPGILHSKSWLRDDDVAAVGSMNLSRSSMARARELTARVEDPTFAATYAKFHSDTRAGAHQVQRDEVDSLGLKALGLLGKVGIQF